MDFCKGDFKRFHFYRIKTVFTANNCQVFDIPLESKQGYRFALLKITLKDIASDVKCVLACVLKRLNVHYFCTSKRN